MSCDLLLDADSESAAVYAGCSIQAQFLQCGLHLLGILFQATNI